MNKAHWGLLSMVLIASISGCASQTEKKESKLDQMTEEAIYARGVKHIQKGLYDQAIEDFEALDARHPFGESAVKAQLATVYTYYQREDFPNALAAVDRFIKVNPTHEDLDYALYMKGMVHFHERLGAFNRYLPVVDGERDTDSFEKAYRVFGRLVAQFPDSAYAKDASQRMVYVYNLMAHNELIAAKYYFNRKAYVASANRAQRCIKRFEKASVVPDAIDVAINSFDALGDSTSADAMRQFKRQNFGSHKMAQVSLDELETRMRVAAMSPEFLQPGQKSANA